MAKALKMINYPQVSVVKNLTQIREGETKLGETIYLLDKLENLAQCPAPFVVLGLPEDVGVRANLGRAGASSAWPQFLAAFLNVQHNSFLAGTQFCLAGSLAFADEVEAAQKLDATKANDLKKLRAITERVDQKVSEVLEAIFKANKIPIVIGGGHNNAFGILKGHHLATGQPLNVLNIDPHADFRALEGRHSGNGFSYAYQAGYLKRYAVYGLHQSYNAEGLLEAFKNNANLTYQSFDDLVGKSTAEQDQLFKNQLNWLGPDTLGLELDMDAITGFAASAQNASGFSLNQARLLIKTAAALRQPAYLHLPEAAPLLAANKGEQTLVGKSLAYLVCDFVKSY